MVVGIVCQAANILVVLRRRSVPTRQISEKSRKTLTIDNGTVRYPAGAHGVWRMCGWWRLGGRGQKNGRWNSLHWRHSAWQRTSGLSFQLRPYPAATILS